jgi:hypothetical protein
MKPDKIARRIKKTLRVLTGLEWDVDCRRGGYIISSTCHERVFCSGEAKVSAKATPCERTEHKDLPEFIRAEKFIVLPLNSSTIAVHAQTIFNWMPDGRLSEAVLLFEVQGGGKT